jgi:hypothetical protein
VATRRVKHPAPSRKDHEKFCVTEGWTTRKAARRKTGTHHVNYELALPDGRILLTRVSHPVNRNTYGPRLWAHILRDQLEVTEAEFWACAENQVVPERGATTEPPAEAIPLGVVTTLINQFHIPEAEVRAMTRDEAIQRLVEGYAEQRRE